MSDALGARIRQSRQDAKMTAAGVAARMHVTANTIRGWESGRRHPTVLDLERYLRIVGATLTLGKGEI